MTTELLVRDGLRKLADAVPSVPPSLADLLDEVPARPAASLLRRGRAAPVGGAAALIAAAVLGAVVLTRPGSDTPQTEEIEVPSDTGVAVPATTAPSDTSSTTLDALTTPTVDAERPPSRVPWEEYEHIADSEIIVDQATMRWNYLTSDGVTIEVWVAPMRDGGDCRVALNPALPQSRATSAAMCGPIDGRTWSTSLVGDRVVAMGRAPGATTIEGMVGGVAFTADGFEGEFLWVRDEPCRDPEVMSCVGPADIVARDEAGNVVPA